MTPTPAAAPVDDPERVAAFEARIARGESIEPKDWMPERYRRLADPDRYPVRYSAALLALRDRALAEQEGPD